MRITLPRELAIDAQVKIAITANDSQHSPVASTELVGMVGKPKR